MKSKLRSWMPGFAGLTSRAALLLLALLLPMWRAVAQVASPEARPEMAEGLRQSGKIYVVVIVIAVVLAGLLLFLVSLDRKLSRLEKEVAQDR